MEEQRNVTAYLGPEKGRWTPASWAAVVEAAGGGLLDETHWVELKADLPPGNRGSNLELAKDLASLAVDGGLFVVGVKDDDGRAGKVCGAALAGLDDRVDQVARDGIHPSLEVRCHRVPDPDRPGVGCLLVHVPSSAGAPHMVDNVYYGRGDKSKFPLGDERVREILASRARGRGGHGQDRGSEQGQDGVAVPAVPQPHLVGVDAQDALGGLEARLDRPAAPGDADQGGQGGTVRGVAVEERELGVVVRVAAYQHLVCRAAGGDPRPFIRVRLW
jgi:hypothetical protein